MSRDSRMPLARPSAEFLIEHLDGEVLVYDQRTHGAHCLTAAAASVWQMCDGRTSRSEAAAALAASGSSERLDAVLDHLAQAGLLRPAARKRRVDRGRRRLMIRGVAAAVAAPVVFSIIAPSVAEAAPCGTKGLPCCQPGNTCKNGAKACVGGICKV